VRAAEIDVATDGFIHELLFLLVCGDARSACAAQKQPCEGEFRRTPFGERWPLQCALHIIEHLLTHERLIVSLVPVAASGDESLLMDPFVEIPPTPMLTGHLIVELLNEGAAHGIQYDSTLRFPVRYPTGGMQGR